MFTLLQLEKIPVFYVYVVIGVVDTAPASSPLPFIACCFRWS